MNILKISGLIFIKTNTNYENKIEYEHIIDNRNNLLCNYTCLIIDFYIKEKIAMFSFRSNFYSSEFYFASVHIDNYQKFLDNESANILIKLNHLLNDLSRISIDIKQSYDHLDKMLPERILL